MAHVVLFHSILGLRPVEQEIAAAFRAEGHQVSLPDLFGGRSVESYDLGFALKREVGDATVLERARAALQDAPVRTVLAGVSFGAFLIGDLWDACPQATGALLYAGMAPWMEPRRPGFRIAAHIAHPDPFDDEAFFDDWAAEAGDVALTLDRYDGAGHYFLDRSLPDYHPAAAELCLQRSLRFLRDLPEA